MDEAPGDNENSQLIASRFRILDKLGEGNMGQVFLCSDIKLERKVAVKLLPQDASNMSVKRFHIEAKALAQANHQNILSILDFGADGNRLYLVVEYIDGVSLASVIQSDGAMPLSEALPILSQICDGLGYAHDRKILHRDIKPSNVMLYKNKTGKYDVKLVDFGLAKQIESDQFLTKTGSVMGTPPYMSPETAQGKELDARSDIYSLGCLMFELLTGTPPFLGRTHLEIMTMHVHHPAPTLFELSETVFPPRVEEIVGKCLAKAPEDRYQTAKQLANDLERLDASSTIISPDTNYDTRESQPENADKRGWQTILVVVAAVVFLGAGLFLYLDRITKSLEEEPSKLSTAVESDLTSNDADVVGEGVDQIAKEELKAQAIESYDAVLRQPFLYVSGEVTDEQLKAAAKKHHHLKIASFWRSPLRDNKLRYVATLPLEELRIDQTPMEENDYGYIPKMTKLKTLRLTNRNPLPISLIEGLTKLKELETLEIRNTGPSDGHLDAMSRIPKLRTLLLEDYQIDKPSIDALQHSTSLRILAFDECKLSADSFAEIKKLGKLESLAFLAVPLTAGNIKNLGALRVKRLQISTTKTSDHALLQLTNLTGLRELDLSGTPMNGSTEQKLKTSLPGVAIRVGELPQSKNTEF